MPSTNHTSFYPSPPPTNPLDVVTFSTNPQHPLEPWGEFDSIERHGEGGMGVVYKAHHKRLNRFEAVKLLRGGSCSSSHFVERFRFEAEATAALEHPNIVPVYGAGEVEGIPYFAMKWIDGGKPRTGAGNSKKTPTR